MRSIAVLVLKVMNKTGTEINIDEVGDNGIVKIFSNNAEANAKAMNWIKGIVAIPEVGAVYDAVAKSIMPYGAFVEFMPGKQGLLHISEVSWQRLDSLDGVLKEGDPIQVKLTGLDPKTGKFRLSHKVLTEKPEGYVERPEGERERRPGGGRGGDRRREGGRDRDNGGDRPRNQQEPRSRDQEQSGVARDTDHSGTDSVDIEG